jgi:multidrug efflux pump subunit AcrA (membrane-fusion protein)
MPELHTKKRWKRAKLFGAVAVCLAAIVVLVLAMVTHEPKSAVSSPGPAKAAIVPQVADTKSESEILFRGKSFSVLQRKVVFQFAGEVTDIQVKEGEAVNKGDVLATYKLDRASMMEVHRILYPEQLLNLKKTVSSQKIELEKLNKVSLPIRKLEVDRIEKELSDLKELRAKDLAPSEAVADKERQLEVAKKQLFETQESIRMAEGNVARTTEDLRFYEQKQKRDLDLLEWRADRPYAEDSRLPLDAAFLKAPIAGNVIWMSPELRVNAELPTGFAALNVALPTPMVVRCKAHELELVKLKTGDRGTVHFDAIPDKKYACKISRIPGVSRNPALEVPADYEIECVIDDTDVQIKDGLSCNVRLSIAE